MKVGKIYTHTVTVTKGMLASTLGSGQVDVFATPVMILNMEQAASLCVATEIGDGNVTVGSEVMVSHLSPTPLGKEVCFKAELVEINGRVLKFEVSASDDKATIGRGIHTRVIVDKKKFEEQANS